MASRVMPPNAPDFQRALQFFQTLCDHARTLRASAREFESSYQTLQDLLNMNSGHRNDSVVTLGFFSQAPRDRERHRLTEKELRQRNDAIDEYQHKIDSSKVI